MVDIERVRQYLGMDILGYGQFVEGCAEGSPNPLKEVYGGIVLGGEAFIKEELNQLRRDEETKDFAQKRAVKNVIEPEEIIRSVA